MQYTASKLYKYHSSNLRFLETALKNNAASARTAIRTQNKDATKTFVRVHHLLLGAWAEVRLCKLLNEHQSFDSSEMSKIDNCQSQLDKWNKVVELAFRRRYNVKKALLSEDSLDPTTYHRYQVISGVINNELKDIIELRNRIAHGQWEFLLNSEATSVEADKMEKVRRENLQSLIFKKRMINFLADLIHDLVVSPDTFERDFDKHFKGVRRFQKNIVDKPYANYESKLVASYQNGKQKQLDRLEASKQQIRVELENELRPQIRKEVIGEIQSNQKPKSLLEKLKRVFA
ncbi:hypothetical protein [Pseudoalteromonas rubra]|uniref:hypothetical protein n=1 Tax=Pseudoalteromonas rubra TaxID=43658 RepID=UPI000696C8DF|nr:hypothetical protein [Pseudoalteromonas rubra]